MLQLSAYLRSLSSLELSHTFHNLVFTLTPVMTTQPRINREFLVRLAGKTLPEALGTLQEVSRDETVSRSRVFQWRKRFKERREDVEDDSRSGRPSTSRTADNVERVKQMLPL